MHPIITIITDFGTTDGYVGEMKGVLKSAARDAELIDITHEIPPQDVECGRLTLARVWRRFPPGSVHLVVVDPGVGSARAALAVSSDERFVVGPDNGVLSPALLVAGARAVQLPLPARASVTFHGRDVFAPAAAALAMGARLDTLGADAVSPIVLRTPEAMRAADGSLHGEIILIDRFGNAVTNLFGLSGDALEINGRSVTIRQTYSEIPPGELAGLVGSTGFLELAMRDGDAAKKFGLERGAKVRLTRRGG